MEYTNNELRKRINFIHKTIQELCPGAPGYECKDTWESIKFLPGYEKPPKEEFEAKLKELVDAQPLKELRQERDRRLQAVDWVDRATSHIDPRPQRLGSPTCRL